MNNKAQRNAFRKYYSKVLLQFLGLEKEVFRHTEHTVTFYHKNAIYILWYGANKLQEKKSGRWIINADTFIINNVLNEKSAPTFNQYTNPEIF